MRVLLGRKRAAFAAERTSIYEVRIDRIVALMVENKDE